MKLGDYIIIWTEGVPGADSLAKTVRAQGGELLAAGPIHDVSERNARATPSGLVIARFSTAESASAWFATTGEQLDGTALLVAGAVDPVWWPPEMEDVRPDWSYRAEFPRDRLGLFVCVWVEVIDRDQFMDYSQHYRWTVEHAGGVVLVPGARPSQTVLRGGPGPNAMAVMGWPADEKTRRAWYDGEHYRPYREQRHRSSRSTNVSVFRAATSSLS
jgi:uncharacterized protein (DUF1330 family)